MTTIVWDTNIVVGLLSRTDALHSAAVLAAGEWEVRVDEHVAEIAAHYRASDVSLRMPDALILATGQHIGAAAVLTGDKRLARVAPGLAQLVVP